MKRNDGNIVIVGKTVQGKSFLLQDILTRMQAGGEKRTLFCADVNDEKKHRELKK